MGRLELLLLAFVSIGGLLSTSVFAEEQKKGDKWWKLTQRLRNDYNGQSFVNFSDSIHSLGNTVAYGTTSGNLGKGEVHILYDGGTYGLQHQAILRDPEGIVGDLYGSEVHLFSARKLLHICVSAEAKKGAGAVFLYRQNPNRTDLWELQKVYFPPDGFIVNNFGRALLYDGHNFLINAERRYPSGPRFEVSAINIRGTSYFHQTDGVSPLGCDPVFVYQLEEQRNNGTLFFHKQTLAEASYKLDFGKTMAATEKKLAIGGSFREALKYGHGTDGDLVVSGLYLLDGSAEYNFNSVYIKKGGTLTVGRYDAVSGSGGSLRMRIKTELFIEEGGAINLTDYGYPGGATAFTGGQPPERGFGPGGGAPATSTFIGVLSCDYDGSVSVSILQLNKVAATVTRPVNSTEPFAEACGGGGSYGTAGTAGTTVYCGTSGAPGATYGDPLLEQGAPLGSGGGSGHPWKVGSGGRGGNGGGSIVIYAKRVTNHGHIEANGGNGANGGYFSGAGGGGSGGSIYINGDNLANYGYIYAKGGRGGVRAIGSGFGGDEGVRGGDGGMGRILFDFLTTQSHGHVVPVPRNITTFLGDVLIYDRENSTKLWKFTQYLPRLPKMMFIGHCVTLYDNLLVVSSDQRTPVRPIQRVFLINITTIASKNISNITSRYLTPPDEQDEKFGWRLALNNDTLVVGAVGSSIAYGVVYLYNSTGLINNTANAFKRIAGAKPEDGDYFGHRIQFDFPNLFIQLPFSQNNVTPLPEDPRRDKGCVLLYKWARNVSAEKSFVNCEYSKVTVGVILNCTINLRSESNITTGDFDEMPLLKPDVYDFLSTGIYTFQKVFNESVNTTVNATYNGTSIKSFHVEVVKGIDSLETTVSCPRPATVSQPLTCQITADSGEADARVDFDVQVYWMGAADTHPNGTVVHTAHGNYLDAFSPVISDSLTTEYPLLFPSVSFKSANHYEFTFRPWQVGYFGVFVMYKRVALKFPNPVVLRSDPAPVDETKSYMTCPADVAPNRTYMCYITFLTNNSYPTGNASTTLAKYKKKESGYSLNATILDINNTSTQIEPEYMWWSGAGRMTLVYNVTIPYTANVTYAVKYNNKDIPVEPNHTRVSYTYPRICNRFPEVQTYIDLLNEQMYLDIDPLRYGEWVEARELRAKDSSWCDEPRI